MSDSNKKTLSNVQMEFAFEVEIEKNIDGITMGVLENGIPYLDETGLAKLCGVHRKTLYRIAKEWDENVNSKRNNKLKEILKDSNYNMPHLYTQIQNKGLKQNAYGDVVCMAILEYFAFEDEEPRKEALQNHRLLTRVSFRQYIYQKVGYTDTRITDKWKYFLDKVDINFDKVPEGFFSIFKEISGLIVSLIRSGVVINDKSVPDISVGQCWAKYWKDNNLDAKYGARQKYEHNYPDYYPQAKSNPQEAYIYPDAALPEFRKWFNREYIENKFPVYLLIKTKQQLISQEDQKKILVAISDRIPKQIENKN